MGQYLAKQPNGRYCIFSTVSDCPTFWNLTAEEYITLCSDIAKEEARGDLIEADREGNTRFDKISIDFEPNCMSKKQFAKFLEETQQKLNKED